ncbi:MAG: hypothetical protein ACP59X_22540 [Solidesulfovibrio sp. DCME]|uniref:hypothetical protein n=1 Tax=Solidesulfovibrio sp. DCME TaxID=3447380 RepID=UPI003D0A2779
MATDKKSLPDADDDIIDLTDLVEEGSDAATSGDDGPVDMSFEQELEDLFGDAAPEAAKAAAPPAAATPGSDDDDLIDLAGLGFDDDAPAPAKSQQPADDDLIDLAGLGLDDDTPTMAKAEPTAADDDIVDLAGLGLDEEAAAKPEAAMDMDLANLGLGDLEPETPTAEADDEAFPDLDGLGRDEAPKPAPPVSEDDALADLFAASPEPAPAVPAEPENEAMDLTDMDLGALEPDMAKADKALADMLELPDEAPDITELSAIDALTPPAQPPVAADALDAAGSLDAPAGPVVAAAAVGAATLAAVTMAATAAPTAPEPAVHVGAIDLGALDNLIDAAKGPPPAPEIEEPTAKARLDALGARLEALETTTATLLDRLESQTATDGDSLAAALSARLEDALSERLEAVLSGLPPAPDVAGLRAEIMAELDTRAVRDRTRLLADLAQTLDKRFEALAEGLANAAAPAPVDELVALGQALSRLEAQGTEREAAFKDFASTVETRLAELRRDLPQPGEFATQTSLSDGLETLRETLSRDIAGSLDERLGELRRELRETLAGDIAASLDERLAELRGELRQAQAEDMAATLAERLTGLAEEARTAAREETQALGEVLSGRIEALESDRLDPDALADRIRAALAAELPDAEALAALAAKPDRQELDTALASLRQELSASLEKTVPKVAATVIREEIAALAKELL